MQQNFWARLVLKHHLCPPAKYGWGQTLDFELKGIKDAAAKSQMH